MKEFSMSRRRFLKTSAATLAVTNPLHIFAESKGVDWPIGCLNRPWMKSPKFTLDYDATLDAIKTAGYKFTGLLTPNDKEPLFPPELPPGMSTN